MPRSSEGTPRIEFRSGDLLPKLEARVGGPRATSENVAAKRDLKRYYDLLAEALPALRRPQALLICEALNGTLFLETASPARQLSYELHDVPPALYEKHKVDKKTLVNRVADLSPAEALAVIDAVERFWNGTSEGLTVTDVGLCGPPEQRN
jgi:hypothetical protein